MPTYEITSPDGRKFRVTAPDDASQEDVLRYAQQNMPSAQPAAEDPGALQAGVIGAGRVLDRTIAGAQALVRGGAAALARPFAPEYAAKQDAMLAALKTEQQGNDKAYAGLQAQHPIATTVGEMVPMVAALPAAGTVGGAAAVSALPGLVEYGTPEERLQRGALGAAGGAVGALAGKAVARAIQPLRPAATQANTAAQAAADRLGVELRPGEITGSRPLRWMESTLNDLPFSGGMAQQAERARAAAINSGAARSIGQTADEITPQVLSQARNDIGSVFDNLLANRRITLDQQFRKDVAGIVDSKVMKELRDDSIDTILAPFKKMPPGTIRVSGDWFQQNKTALDAAIRAAYNTPGQAGKAQALEGLEDALVGAAKRSMNTTERHAYDAAQKQWASLRLLETGKVVDGGNVMPGRLDSALISRYKGAYKEGKITGDLADIGTLAQAYKPLPQSGTTPRAIYSGMAGGMALANPLHTVGMLAAPPLLQKALQSNAGRAYLTRGLVDVTPEMERLLLQGGYGLLGLPLATAAN